MKVCIIIGTRPEIIKMAPVIRRCISEGHETVIVHTGQHYSWNMDKIFFKELNIPAAKHNLEVGSCSNLSQTSLIMQRLETVLNEEKPDVVLVLGDTNTVLAGALAANKMGIKLGHIEAGLRSYDRRMPEEFNRIVADHLADWLFCPTPGSLATLRKEGIPDSRLFMTGNTIVDSVRQNLDIAKKSSDPFSGMGLKHHGYVLATAHRQEYVDNPASLGGIIGGLEGVATRTGMPVLFPIHPRTRKMVDTFGITIPPGIRTVEPLGFFDFLLLEEKAALILTDSGGVREEACILQVPCVTMRDNTERPETVQVGANVLAGTDSGRIVSAAERMLKAERKWNNPFGDGTAAEKIVDAIRHA